MTKSSVTPLNRRVIFLASLGLLIPVFLVGMAFLAVKSDADNQKKYDLQREVQAKRIAERERTAQQNAASDAQVNISAQK